jgi:type IV secretory pathway VirB10-like protein
MDSIHTLLSASLLGVIIMGFIKSLFGGIFGFIGRLLGLNKSDYVLDLGESDTAKAEPAKAEVKKEAKPEPAKAQATPAQPAKAKAAPAPAPKPAAAKAKTEPVPAGFAPNYLMPAVTSTRRRPGANMSSYLSMARQMKSN